MKASWKLGLVWLLTVLLLKNGVQHGAEAADAAPSINDYANAQHLEKLSGFVTVYRSVDSGAVYLVVPTDRGSELLYQSKPWLDHGPRQIVQISVVWLAHARSPAK
jgi:hypothetical protein